MRGYWKAHYELACKEFAGSLLKQVGKTVNGGEISQSQIDLIVLGIHDRLQLSSLDTVLDLCCGNGLITRQIAPSVRKIVAVDYTRGLIEAANRHNAHHNVRYIASDILHLDNQYFRDATKVLMYEALQHLSIRQLIALLKRVKRSAPARTILLGSIPDRRKLRTFYNTAEKYAFYESREREGRPHLGRWWLREELMEASRECGFMATTVPQSPKLYTASYRFDAILERLS